MPGRDAVHTVPCGRIKDGDDFLVVIIHPDKIASGPFQGIDIAKDQTCG